MDFRHLIVTCLFSKLRLPFDNQKVKENYAIFLRKIYIADSPIYTITVRKVLYSDNSFFHDVFVFYKDTLYYLLFLRTRIVIPQAAKISGKSA